jgi:hypothetical protein
MGFFIYIYIVAIEMSEYKEREAKQKRSANVSLDNADFFQSYIFIKITQTIRFHAYNERTGVERIIPQFIFVTNKLK